VQYEVSPVLQNDELTLTDKGGPVNTYEQLCSQCRGVLEVLGKADLDRLTKSGLNADRSEQLNKLMQLFRIRVCTKCGYSHFEACVEITDVLKENKDDILGIS
jgi:hypothetical protein